MTRDGDKNELEMAGLTSSLLQPQHTDTGLTKKVRCLERQVQFREDKIEELEADLEAVRDALRLSGQEIENQRAYTKRWQMVIKDMCSWNYDREEDEKLRLYTQRFVRDLLSHIRAVGGQGASQRVADRATKLADQMVKLFQIKAIEDSNALTDDIRKDSMRYEKSEKRLKKEIARLQGLLGIGTSEDETDRFGGV